MSKKSAIKRDLKGVKLETVPHVNCFCQYYPNGLIGQKVVYNKKYLEYYKKNGEEPDVPLPERGYFTILSAYLTEYGAVIVTLDETSDKFKTYHKLATNWIEPYKEETNVQKGGSDE